MKASVLDLRYRMKEVLAALARREVVHLYHRRKLKGSIHPTEVGRDVDVIKHPFFGCSESSASVDSIMNRLRGGRVPK